MYVPAERLGFVDSDRWYEYIRRFARKGPPLENLFLDCRGLVKTPLHFDAAGLAGGGLTGSGTTV